MGDDLDQLSGDVLVKIIACIFLLTLGMFVLGAIAGSQ